MACRPRQFLPGKENSLPPFAEGGFTHDRSNLMHLSNVRAAAEACAGCVQQPIAEY
jgi:hypothetical protein